MEAGAAAGQAGVAGAADGQGQPAQQGDPNAQQQAQQPAGLDPNVLSQLSAIPGQLEELRSWMESQAVTQEPESQVPAEADLGFIDPSNPGYDPQAAAGQLLELLQQQNNQALAEAIAPIQQQVQQVQNAREADALAAEFPELEKQEVADQVIRMARDWVSAAGLPEEYAGNMQVIRAVYMMGRAAELANSEGQPAPDAASLEGAGGASPGGSSAGQITAESIIGAQRRSPLPF